MYYSHPYFGDALSKMFDDAISYFGSVETCTSFWQKSCIFLSMELTTLMAGDTFSQTPLYLIILLNYLIYLFNYINLIILIEFIYLFITVTVLQ